MKDNKCIIAHGLGVNAFMKGQKCIPAHDKLFLELIKGNQVGEGIKPAKAWLKGWTEANLTKGLERYITK